MSPFNWLIMNMYFTLFMLLLLNIIFFNKIFYTNVRPLPPFSKFYYKLKW